MGVRTTADENKDMVDSHLSQIKIRTDLAINLLESVVDLDIWGGDSWTEDFRKQVYEDIDYLTEVARKIREMKRRY